MRQRPTAMRRMPEVPPGNSADCQRHSRPASSGWPQAVVASFSTSTRPSTRRSDRPPAASPSRRITEERTASRDSRSPSMAAVDHASSARASTASGLVAPRPSAAALPSTMPCMRCASAKSGAIAFASKTRFGQPGCCQIQRGSCLFMSRIVADSAQELSRIHELAAHARGVQAATIREARLRAAGSPDPPRTRSSATPCRTRRAAPRAARRSRSGRPGNPCRRSPP